MQDITLEVRNNRKLADQTYEMVLHDMDRFPETIRPGQFINLKLDGYYLRRPISICDWTEHTVTIVYKIAGRGTEAMSQYETGKTISVLMPLGNGFNTGKSGERPLLAGGGAGVPPMYGLCKELLAEGKKPIALLGFNSAEEIFYADAFRALGVRPVITTADGSRGIKGFVTDALRAGILHTTAAESPCPEPTVSRSFCAGVKADGKGAAGEPICAESETDGNDAALPFTYFYACGPISMLRALNEAIDSRMGGQMSFEQRMGCGFGACMGCTCKTKYGAKRICKEGPVLERSEISW